MLQNNALYDDDVGLWVIPFLGSQTKAYVFLGVFYMTYAAHICIIFSLSHVFVRPRIQRLDDI